MPASSGSVQLLHSHTMASTRLTTSPLLLLLLLDRLQLPPPGGWFTWKSSWVRAEASWSFVARSSTVYLSLAYSGLCTHHGGLEIVNNIFQTWKNSLSMAVS